MNNRYIRIGFLMVFIAFVLCSCGKAEAKEESTAQPAADRGMETEAAGTEEPATEPDPIEQYGLDILPAVLVEAGTESLEPEMFFEEYSGQQLFIATPVTPEELAVAGQTYPVDVIYKDHELTIDVEVIDTIAPTIAQVENIVVKAGNTIAYKKAVETSDNSSNALDLQIDNSAVDVNTPGIYNVVYTVTDTSGNSASAEVALTVVEATSHTEEDVKDLAEKVIESVVEEDATDYEKALALFQYVQWSITYSYTSGDRSSVWSGAYEGLHDHVGDCYTYYATYAVLLTYCGIDNECVARIGGESNHWWNLVNTGDGWYHCDTSPRRRGDGYYCFMQTDAQIAAYTEAYPEKPNYYTFDGNSVPGRETEIIYGYEPETITARFCTEAVTKRIQEMERASAEEEPEEAIPEEQEAEEPEEAIPEEQEAEEPEEAIPEEQEAEDPEETIPEEQEAEEQEEAIPEEQEAEEPEETIPEEQEIEEQAVTIP